MVRLERLAKEEEARRQADAERRKEERRKRYNEEVERTVALENEAQDFATACRILAYVKAVMNSFETGEMDEKTAILVDWATKKADWFDPTVVRDDELFGERKHEKIRARKL